MSDLKKILVLMEEIEGDAPHAVSLETLGVALELKRHTGCEVVAASAGCIASLVASFGVHTYCAAPPSTDQYRPEWYVALVEKVCREIGPDVVLFGHTPMGQDVAPRIAARMAAGLVTDSTGLAVEDGKLLASKQIQGGVATATYSFLSAMRMITVRSKVGKIPEKAEQVGEIIELEITEDAFTANWELVEKGCEECDEVRLDEAGVVVSGGRGIGGYEGFDLLRRLASLLKGALGSSRPPCDLGWVPSSRQVGITGAIINPDVYIAIGISGASQHLSGMCDSKTIVAINKDKDADVFKVADFGVVGDFKAVVTGMIETIDKSRGSGN